MIAPILEAVGLRVERAGQTILDVPSLAVKPGELLVVLGPNGAGKSTLLRCLARLEQPTAGTIRFQGQEVIWRDAVAYRRRTALVFQEPLLLDMSVFDNVALGLRLRGVPGPERDRRVWTWLERLGIAGLARRSARVLSGGEARRVSLARAFVIEPEILFLDEPFSALDAPTRASLMRDLIALLTDGQLTAILVTHDQAEARALADRVAILLAGRIVQCDAVDAVFTRPASPAVRDFLRLGELPQRRPTGPAAEQLPPRRERPLA